MPFKEPYETYYSTIIKPAVVNANLEVKRGDSLFTPTPIMGDVWLMIQAADVLVAELTEKNPNVFYELGLGHAIGKPIILVSETMEDVPFDLQQLRVILYDKDDPSWGNKLKNAITTALTDTLVSPIEAVPPMFRKKVKSQAPEDSALSLRMLDLERRLAALSSSQKVRLSEMDVDWDLVTKYITKTAKAGRKAPSFSTREHAVGWSISRLKGRMHADELRSLLIRELSEIEAERVYTLARQGFPNGMP